MPRIIRVNKKNRGHLQTAKNWAIGELAAKATGDFYDYVKAHLNNNGVDHVDEHVDDVSEVHPDHVYTKE